ncbi:MAG TPA: hypothetical protein VKZ72_07880 [Acidimicrobiales bacterium]|nr:hypothetical protein [Acidimicrobiales bacterium]
MHREAGMQERADPSTTSRAIHRIDLTGRVDFATCDDLSALEAAAFDRFAALQAQIDQMRAEMAVMRAELHEARRIQQEARDLIRAVRRAADYLADAVETFERSADQRVGG